MNKRLQMAVRNAACMDCKLHQQAVGKDICVTGQGPNDARLMVVTKFPLTEGGKSRTEIENYMVEVGLDPAEFMWCSALKCRVWDANPGKTDMKACRPYMSAELDFVKPSHVLALGTEPLFATTGKSGIMKYRGGVYPYSIDTDVFATISPAMVARNPGLRQGFIADLLYFKRMSDGQGLIPPHHTPGDRRTYVGSKAVLRDMLTAVRTAGYVAYDIETTGASEFASDARIVSIACTVIPLDGDMDDAWVWELPLFHPQSPWRRQWQVVIRWLYRALRKAKRRIAHNAKYDTRWLRHFGHVDGELLNPTYDTIIALALLDENASKGLKPSAQQRLGADPWGIDTRDLLNTPLDDVLEYNGLDTWHTMRLYFNTRTELLQHKRLARLFQHLMMPMVQELIGVEHAGVYVHRDKLYTNWAIVQGRQNAVEEILTQFVPKELPDAFYNRRGEAQVNFNPSNFLRWWLFDFLELPILARGKSKDDGSKGAPSTAEAVMMELADHIDKLIEADGKEYTNIPKLLLERSGYEKRQAGFFKPYAEQLTADSRLHTTFKPWGTVTGRLSSGKEDAEKITAGRNSIRGVNLQQVPRDPLVRGVFGAPRGSSFVEADYSQIELRIAAFLAQEPTMLHLYATGQDIHMAMAMRMTGKPASAITKEERKRAKAVNFGFLYGMGWAKFVLTAWTNYQLRVSEEESRAFRTAFFNQFPQLIPWHAKQRRLAHKYGRVETPMGRVRHLPDIYSPDDGVRAEAERQAINSPVQAFASDMAALSLVHISRKFRALGLRGHPVGTVHDAVNFEIPNRELHTALPIIKYTMENLPLEQLFGIHLTVPIVADIKVGRSWGGAHEVPVELIGAPQRQLAVWLRDHREDVA